MALTSHALNAYQQLLVALLPQGQAWATDDPNSNLNQLLSALAPELTRIGARVEDLKREMDPRTTIEMLPDWEQAYGLPDCVVATSVSMRRSMLLARVVAEVWQGVIDAAFIVHIAAVAGYTVQVEESVLSRCDQAVCGDALIADAGVAEFSVHASEYTYRQAIAGEACCDDRIEDWGNEVLECVIQWITPAHLTPLFFYHGDLS
ncbi:YmfQ family protein [Magnetococcus sp. PR-3]|uniref:YmfQ family protein n=1 Tax=Magnetococcus sp. PR-3 TaxID=3120355 RepID=UPI002FCE4EAE